MQCLLPYAAVALISGAYFFLFVRILTTTVDEGTYLYEAQLVAHGAVPFRDFPEVSAGGEFYWVALFFKLMGTGFLAARTALWITGLATVLVAFYIARRIGGTGLFAALFVAITSIPLMVMNSPHYESNLFALAALAVFLRAQQRDERWTLYIAGILAGVASCFLQQKGLYVAIALAAAILIARGARSPACRAETRLDARFARYRNLLDSSILFGGFFTVLAAGATFYALEGALLPFIRSNLRVAASYHNLNSAPYGWEVWAKMLPGWFSHAHKTMPAPAAALLAVSMTLPYLLIMALPFLLGALLWFWKKEFWRRELVPCWLAAYAIWLAEIHRWDIGHLRDGCILLAVVFLTVCEKHTSAWPRWCALVFGASLLLNGVAGATAALGFKTPIHSRHGTLLGRHSDVALQFLLTHTKPGDYVLVYPYRPIYYFLADVRDPTPFTVMVYNGDFAAFREAVRDVETKNVRYVLWDSVFSGLGLRQVFPAYKDPPPGKLVMEPYLESHYRQIAFANGFRILERKEK